MKPIELLEILHLSERLKDTTRHCDTSKGRRESVAEHSWRLALFAFLLKDEFPEADMDKVIQMCLIHDLGEAFTGDIPVFLKTDLDEEKEAEILNNWVESLPSYYRDKLKDLYKEMDELETIEAKIYKALDGMEAVIQHNESDISTWEEHEYELQLKHANDKVQFSPYMKELREVIKQESLRKIEKERK